MDYFGGLDVSVKETSVCIVDDTGRIVREAKVASEPEELLAVLQSPSYHFKRIGLEAGPLSQWLSIGFRRSRGRCWRSCVGTSVNRAGSCKLLQEVRAELLDPTDEDKLDRVERLQRMHDREGRAITALMVRLRLTTQQRIPDDDTARRQRERHDQIPEVLP
jgi:hypothetical protein